MNIAPDRITCQINIGAAKLAVNYLSSGSNQIITQFIESVKEWVWVQTSEASLGYIQ